MKIERKPSTALLPTPVVLLSVAGHDKEKANIITLAWAGTVCSDPPMLSVAIRPTRHPHRLVNAAREFVVNVPRAGQLTEVDLAGVWSGAQHDKFGELGLTATPASRVAAPLIEECPVNIEVKKLEQIDRGDWDHIWYMGKVVHTDIAKNYDRTNALIYWDGEFRTPSPVLRKI